MDYFFQLLVGGILVGGMYSLLALGFVVVYKATKVINFASGQLLLAGAYLCWIFISLFGLLLGIVCGVIASIILGLLVERFTIRPLIGQPLLAVIMMTIALSVLFDGLITASWIGLGAKVYPHFLSTEPLKFGDFMISRQLLFSFIATLFFFGLFYLFFKHSKRGLWMRAVAEHQQASQACGVNVPNVFRLVWVFAFVVAVVGGFLMGNINGVQPVMRTVGLKVFPVVILGGLESIGGCLIAGPIVGVAEAFAVGYLGIFLGFGGLEEVVPYLLIVMTLFVKPYGLFGETRIERI